MSDADDSCGSEDTGPSIPKWLKPPSQPTVHIRFLYQGKEEGEEMLETATLSNFATRIQSTKHIPVENQKLLVAKVGMFKAPFDDTPVEYLLNKKVTLFGTSTAEMRSMNEAAEMATRRGLAAERRPPKVWSRKPRATEEAGYTFMTIRPLENLPNPERSMDFLKRLASDPGIITAMRKHKFTVALLTEMDPAAYTESTHEGTTRILGLNRNRGEVIELRLRTDAYDGYRNYKVIRNTLCHELAHNVHGPHDRKFWDLCHQIEKEVAKGDWKSGGRQLGNAEYFEPSGDVAYDHGGWEGGSYVLGGKSLSGDATTTASSAATTSGALSRREIIAMAAEARIQRLQEEKPPEESGGEAAGSQEPENTSESKDS
ncbi:WLM domain-containing protein [Xylariaceae sp. FL1019]|nr:WLM domain-containing protein [Xylariaceae sp. FL1019]